MRFGQLFLRPLPNPGDFFWDWWLREYFAVRVLVVVTATRVVSWPTLRAEGEPAIFGAPMPAGASASQLPPKNGTTPRVDAVRAAKRAAALPHQLLAYLPADGVPVAVPVRVGSADAGGIRLHAAAGWIPPGQRRAALLAHRYRPKLVGLRTSYLTGWLSVSDDGTARYAPHTEKGLLLPPNKTLLLLANGLMAKIGVHRSLRR